MRHIRLRVALELISLTFFFCSRAFTQPSGSSSSGTNAGPALQALQAAFSSGNSVNQVTLSGYANWYAGSLQDSGPVSLVVSNGSSSMELALSSLGDQKEISSGLGEDAECQLVDAYGNSTLVNGLNCWRPAVWFLPAFSLQAALIPSTLGTIDLGDTTVGAWSTIYHHLESQMVFTDLPSQLLADVMSSSTMDFGLDGSSSLPAVITYAITPNDGSLVPITVEIHYSNYAAVSGVQIPFGIQRYVNGSLQLDITVNQVLVN